MVEARQRGEQGVRQGEARLLSMLLERRFGPLPVDVARGIDTRVLDADSVDGVFGDPEPG